MKRIDIAKVLKDKNPRLARWVPGFVVRWIERLIEAKRLNEILDLYETCAPIDFIDGALGYVGVKYSIHGAQNIPSDGKIVFAANHPLGGVDGMILATAIDKIRPGVRLIVNDILLNIEPLRPIFFGINKHGRQAAGCAQQMDELYCSDAPIINFPAGMCSRLAKKGVIEDLPWKRSFINRSIDSGRTIIPTYVEASNSKGFYRLAALRKRLGVKINLEMLLLPREVFYQRGREVKIYFGQPLIVDQSLSTQQWCDLIREKVYEFKK